LVITALFLDHNTIYLVGVLATKADGSRVVDLLQGAPEGGGFAMVVMPLEAEDEDALRQAVLSGTAGMPINVATAGMPVLPGHVYMLPGEGGLTLNQNVFLASKPVAHGLDEVCFSLAKNYPGKMAVVALSQVNERGLAAMKRAREEGGLVLVSEATTAGSKSVTHRQAFDELVDKYVPLGDIWTGLSRLLDIDSDSNELYDYREYLEILNQVKKQTGLDFTNYKEGTAWRRIGKRLHFTGSQTLQQYIQLLRKDRNECQLLANEFSIRVTSFFRDPEAYETLSTLVLPKLFAGKGRGDQVRVWVAGCSTGNEAFSLAILLQEYIDDQQLTCDFKIFATDIDKGALSIASKCTFKAEEVNDVPDPLLQKYFVSKNDSFKVITAIRERIVFAYHNLLTDPPFIRMDLVSCRNLLIYLKPDLQKKVFNNFHFSLNNRGFLFLGHSETVAGFDNIFHPIQKHAKIFLNTAEFVMKNTTLFEPLGKPTIKSDHDDKTGHTMKRDAKMNAAQYFSYSLARQFAPKCVFVNSQFDILYINGDLSDLFDFPQGVPQFNLVEMANKKHSVLFRDGVRECLETDKIVTYAEVPFSKSDRNFALDLKFKPFFSADLDDRVVLVEFHQQVEVKTDAGRDERRYNPSDLQVRKIASLEYELEESKAKLQSTVEKLETTNEELQASNEELLASNEELQSTNEEIQSVNEELNSLNTELSVRVSEMAELNNDVNNMLESTEMGVIFLDEQLRVRKFTPAIKKYFNLHEGDIGRPISSLANYFGSHTLEENCRNVLASLQPFEREIVNADGLHYLKRITPYRTKENRIEGVVVTFIDIEKVKEAEEALTESYEKYKQLFLSIEGVVFITNEEGVILDVNRVTPGYTREQVLGTLVYDYNNDETCKKIRSGLKRLFSSGKSFTYEAKVHNAALNKQRCFRINVVPFSKAGKVVNAAFISNDLTDLYEGQQAVMEQKQLLEKVVESIDDTVVFCDTNGKFTLFNRTLQRLGYADMMSLPPSEWASKFGLYYQDGSSQIRYEDLPMLRALKGESVSDFTMLLRTNGSKPVEELYLKIFATPIKGPNGDVTGAMAVVKNVTTEIKRVESLESIVEQQKEISALKSKFVSLTSHQMRTPLAAIQANVDLLQLHGLNITADKAERIYGRLNQEMLRLKTLMDDVLTLSKAESGKMSGDAEEIQVDELLRHIVEEHLSHGQDDRRISLSVIGKPRSRRMVKYQVEHAFINLISNALKYSPGKPAPEVEVVYNKKGEVSVQVKDHGIGIPEKDVAHIMDPFFRASNVDGYKGTGLGLSIAAEFLKLNGGKISIESQINAGTTFKVIFYETEGSIGRG
jgi:two-component system, chemotaxis family, CheB/CheR fusion protein